MDRYVLMDHVVHPFKILVVINVPGLLVMDVVILSVVMKIIVTLIKYAIMAHVVGLELVMIYSLVAFNTVVHGVMGVEVILYVHSHVIMRMKYVVISLQDIVFLEIVADHALKIIPVMNPMDVVKQVVRILGMNVVVIQHVLEVKKNVEPVLLVKGVIKMDNVSVHQKHVKR